MKLWKLLLIFLIATLLMYGCIAYLFFKLADTVDSNGGLNSVVERIWEGNKK